MDLRVYRMIVRSMCPTKSFTRVDRRVFTMPNLSDGAKVLYGYLIGLKSGQNFSDVYISKALGISKVVLSRRKRELKNYDLILVEQISARLYFIYIGFTDYPASAVRDRWISMEDTEEEEDNE